MGKFMDFVNEEKSRLENESSQSSGESYPELKHKPIYLTKDKPAVLVQVLPFADLEGFAVKTRKLIGVSYKKKSGDTAKTTLTLDPEENPESEIEGKIIEWQEKEMLTTPFGQARPREQYLVNVIELVKDGNKRVWETDENGDIVVRIMEIAKSAYQEILKNLQDELNDPSGGDSELSFLDPNKAAPIKIQKPAKGETSYHVSVYPQLAQPALPEGWENELEELVPRTKSTEAMNPDWVAALIDMKEGRKPGQRNKTESKSTTNPYAGEATETESSTYSSTETKSDDLDAMLDEDANASSNDDAEYPPADEPEQDESDYDKELQSELDNLLND